MTAATSMRSESARPPTGGALVLAEALIREGILDGEKAQRALARQSARGGWLGRSVVELGFCEPARLADALGRAFRVPRVVLARFTPDATALAMLDPRLCAERVLVPLAVRESGEVLVVAVANPGDRAALAEVAALAGCTVRPVVATEAEILAALAARGAPAKKQAISFGPTESGVMHTESLAESLVPPVPAANDSVGFTPASLPAAPPAQTTALVDLALLTEKLDATESELRRTQRMLRGLLELCLERGLVSRQDLATMLARAQQG